MTDNESLPRVVLLGCGDIGSQLGLLLRSRGHPVLGLRRRPHLLPEGLPGLALDYTDPVQLEPLKERLDVARLIEREPIVGIGLQHPERPQDVRQADAEILLARLENRAFPVGMGDIVQHALHAGVSAFHRIGDLWLPPAYAATRGSLGLCPFEQLPYRRCGQ